MAVAYKRKEERKLKSQIIEISGYSQALKCWVCCQGIAHTEKTHDEVVGLGETKKEVRNWGKS